MIDLDFVERLIRMVDESGIDSLELERGGTRIRVAKSPTGTVTVSAPQHSPAASSAPGNPEPTNPSAPSGGGAAAAAAAVEESGPKLLEITSPMVGTFYRSPNPESAPFVEVGGKIGKGDALCIIEAMKLMNELEAEIEGTIAEICVENAEPVEYGQVLFRVQPA